MMEPKLTNRGFCLYEFKDGYGAECSLQESSAARIEMEDGSVTDGYIWLGVDKERDGFRPGKEIEIHDGSMVKLGARMHLSQSHARDLVPLLQHFVETGELPNITSADNDNKDDNDG